MTGDVWQAALLGQQQGNPRVGIAVIRAQDSVNPFSIENIQPCVPNLKSTQNPAAEEIQTAQGVQNFEFVDLP